MFEKKYSITEDFIDENGHLSEVGYYHYAVQTVWEKSKYLGMDKIYQKKKVGPIVFDTSIIFKKEIFLNDEITVKMYFINVVEDGRKWTRVNEIYNSKGEFCAKVDSNGSFMDLIKRKVVSPPKEIYEMFFK